MRGPPDGPYSGVLKASLSYGFPEGRGIFYELEGRLLCTREDAEASFERSIDCLKLPAHQRIGHAAQARRLRRKAAAPAGTKPPIQGIKHPTHKGLPNLSPRQRRGRSPRSS